jgi:hypothetical protein
MYTHPCRTHFIIIIASRTRMVWSFGRNYRMAFVSWFASAVWRNGIRNRAYSSAYCKVVIWMNKQTLLLLLQ